MRLKNDSSPWGRTANVPREYVPTGSMTVEEMFHLVHIESIVEVDISVRKQALSMSSICIRGRSTNPDVETHDLGA